MHRMLLPVVAGTIVSLLLLATPSSAQLVFNRVITVGDLALIGPDGTGKYRIRAGYGIAGNTSDFGVVSNLSTRLRVEVSAGGGSIVVLDQQDSVFFRQEGPPECSAPCAKTECSNVTVWDSHYQGLPQDLWFRYCKQGALGDGAACACFGTQAPYVSAPFDLLGDQVHVLAVLSPTFGSPGDLVSDDNQISTTIHLGTGVPAISPPGVLLTMMLLAAASALVIHRRRSSAEI